MLIGRRSSRSTPLPGHRFLGRSNDCETPNHHVLNASNETSKRRPYKKRIERTRPGAPGKARGGSEANMESAMDLFFPAEEAHFFLPEFPAETCERNLVPALSAFDPYFPPPGGRLLPANSGPPSGCVRNANRRMIEMLRAIRAGAAAKGEQGDGHRHMLKERQRRKKMKQNYDELHSVLPPGTKTDKNSIIRTAASQILQLQALMAELQSRNEELEARLCGKVNNPASAKINLRQRHPTSAVESMAEALRCLRAMEVKARSIRSMLSSEELSAEMEIDSKELRAAEVQEAVMGALMRVGKKWFCDSEAAKV